MLYRIPNDRSGAWRPSEQLLNWPTLLARHVERWRLRRAAIFKLRRLDDHLLADIGIPRNEIKERARRAAAEEEAGGWPR